MGLFSVHCIRTLAPALHPDSATHTHTCAHTQDTLQLSRFVEVHLPQKVGELLGAAPRVELRHMPSSLPGQTGVCIHARARVHVCVCVCVRACACADTHACARAVCALLAVVQRAGLRHVSPLVCRRGHMHAHPVHMQAHACTPCPRPSPFALPRAQQRSSP